MRWYKLILLTWIIALPAITKAGELPANNEEVVREGVIALNKMIRQNEYNDRHHQSWKNKYVLMLDGNGRFVEQRSVVGNTGLLLDDDELTAINDELLKVNDQKTFGVYEIVYNNWYIDLSKKIPDDANISYLTDYQPWSKDNIRNMIMSEMKAINTEIFQKADLKGFEKKVGIVCGRVVVLLNGMKYRTNVVFDAHGDESWTAEELQNLDSRISPYLPNMSDVKNYLIEYPHALKVAFKNKDKKADVPFMPYEYKPAKGSFFDAVWVRSDAQTGNAGGTGGGRDPIKESGSRVYDYAHVLSTDELKALIDGFVEVSKNQGGYNARVFISNYKTSNEDVAKIREIVNNPGPTDVILWFYVDLDKTTHGALYLGKAVPQQREVGMFMRLAIDIVESLGLGSSNFTLTSLFDALSTFINKAQIPERFYNPEAVDKDGNAAYNPILYKIFLKSGQLKTAQWSILPDVITPAEVQAGGYPISQVEFSFYCGAYNGLVEMVASMPKLAGWLINIILNEGGAREELTTAITAFANKCNLSSTDYYVGVMSPLVPAIKLGACITPIIVREVKMAYSGKNVCMYAATTGKVVFNIVMLIIPLSKAGNIAKIADVLNYIDPFALLLRGMGLTGKLVFVGGRALYSWGKFYLSAIIREGRIVLQVLDDGMRVLTRGEMPVMEVAVAGGRRIKVSVPPGTDLNGDWRVIRYMQDANGAEIVSGEGERVVQVAKGSDQEGILGITDDAGKADGVADDVKTGENAADDVKNGETAEEPKAGGTEEPQAPQVDAYSTVNGRVNKPADRIDKYETFVTIDDVPEIYRADRERFVKLATDPAHVGKPIESKVMQEAMAGLEAERQGLVKGPIRRGPKEIEFYDHDDIPWDVKGPPSRSGMKPKDAVKSIVKKLRSTFVDPVTNKQVTNIRVLLDCTYLNQADHTKIWNLLKAELTPDELGRIVEVNVRL
ncbi:hypothetical protein L3C95_14705 [Chitinophaga filiformis]|uniref:hypothetical protein n=1 Tax=Chitinophaga filiformis TaxID=104663 RepID=UPI001F3D9F4D|nr:hypothetical protein [Chitinophaga filiformis]MCF6404142.1 hypothetical protein [Chitinophaga filiformis]